MNIYYPVNKHESLQLREKLHTWKLHATGCMTSYKLQPSTTKKHEESRTTWKEPMAKNQGSSPHQPLQRTTQCECWGELQYRFFPCGLELLNLPLWHGKETYCSISHALNTLIRSNLIKGTIHQRKKQRLQERVTKIQHNMSPFFQLLQKYETSVTINTGDFNNLWRINHNNCMWLSSNTSN